MVYLQRFYDWLFAWTKGFQSILLLLLRLVWGWLFLVAGWTKFYDLPASVAEFTSLGIPEPETVALGVAIAEAVGGAFLILGLLSRLSAFILAIVMANAYWFAHPEAFKSFEAFTNTGTAPFLYLLVSLIILAFGAGTFSLDALIHKANDK